MNDIIKFTTMVISLLLLILWLASCSKQYHLKRSKHHYQKAIRKGYQPLRDTTYIFDTVTLSDVRYDTIFKDVGDTVRIEKERLKVKYVRDTITNQVYIEGECQADTVIKKIPVTTQETIYIEQSPLEWAGIDKTWEKILFWLVVGLTIVAIVIKFIKPI